MVDGMRKPVADYLATHGRMPRENADIGLAEPSLVTGKYVSRVEVSEGGIIEVTYSSRPPQSAVPALDGATIRFTPIASKAGLLDWKCDSDSLPQKFCPQACRCTKR